MKKLKNNCHIFGRKIKSINNIGLILTTVIIFILPILVNLPISQAASYYAIIIDGTNDWAPSSIIIADPNNDRTTGSSDFEIYNVYAAYSENYLYLGVEIGSIATADFFIALSWSDNISIGIKDMIWVKNVTFLDYVAPELILAIDDEAIQAYDNSTGIVQRNDTIETNMQANAGTTFREVRLLLSDLENPSWINISVFLTATENNKAVIDIAPNDPNVNDSGDPWNYRDYLSTAYNFSLSGPAQLVERTITLDGNLNDFYSDELIIKDTIADTSNDGGDIINVSSVWNATYLFFGIEGPLLSDSGSVRQHTMFIALDTGSGGGTVLPWNRNITFAAGDSAPNFIVCLGEQNAGGGLKADLYEQNNSDFIYKESLTKNFLSYSLSNFTEVGIPLNSIGNPTQVHFSIIVTGRNEGMSAIDVFPNDNGLNKWYNDADVISTYHVSSPGTLKNITCDGSMSDWSQSDFYTTDLGDTIAINADLDSIYCTWDQNYIYISVNGTDPRSTASYLIDLFIAIDYRVGGGTTNFWAKDITFGGSFLPDYIIAVEDQTTSQFLNWTGSAWQDISGSLDNFGSYISFNSEFRISKKDITSNSMNISIFVTADGDNTSAIDVAPNDSGVGPTYNDVDVISSGIYITNLKSFGWKPFDSYPPVISDTADFTTEQYNTTYVTWTINETHADTAIVYVDNTPNPVSFSNNIQYAVNTLSQGVFNYTLWVNDSNGQSSYDDVLVTVSPPTPPQINESTLQASTSFKTLNSAELIAGTEYLNKGDVIISVDITETVGFDKVILNYTKEGDANTYAIIMTTSDTGNTRTYTGTIPNSYLSGGDLVSFWICANDTQGEISYINNSNNLYNFSINLAPQISETSLEAFTTKVNLNSADLIAGDKYVDNNDIIIRVSITEDTGFSNVKIYFRKTGETSFNSVEMQTPDSGLVRTYNVTIAASSYLNPGDVLSFWIWANDSMNLESYINNSGQLYNISIIGSPLIDELSLKASTALTTLDNNVLAAGSNFIDYDDINISVSITSNSGFDIVRIYYKINGSTELMASMTSSDTGTTRTYYSIISALAIDHHTIISFWIWMNDSINQITYINNSNSLYSFKVDAKAPNVSNFELSYPLRYYDLHQFNFTLSDDIDGEYQIISNITGSSQIVVDWTYFTNNTPEVYTFNANIIGTVNLTLKVRDDFGNQAEQSLIISILPPYEQYLPSQSDIIISEFINITNIVVNTPFNLSIEIAPSVQNPFSAEGFGVIEYYQFNIQLKNAFESFMANVNIILNSSILESYINNSFQILIYNPANQSWTPLNFNTITNGLSFNITRSGLFVIIGNPKSSILPEIGIWNYVIFFILSLSAIAFSGYSIVSYLQKKRNPEEIEQQEEQKTKKTKKTKKTIGDSNKIESKNKEEKIETKENEPSQQTNEQKNTADDKDKVEITNENKTDKKPEWEKLEEIMDENENDSK
ncbi:MAG: hypothetical protein ACTSRZ_03935 [Promethearchaeota archaeon]